MKTARLLATGLSLTLAFLLSPVTAFAQGRVARANGDHGIWGVESFNIYAPGATGTGNK